VSASPTTENISFDETAATFGGRLDAAREAKGLSLTSLAQKIGVAQETVEQWQGDVETPRANHIQLLAGMLNVSIVWLISGESNGTYNIQDTYERPTGINDALGEISHLKANLMAALNRLEKLEERLQQE
jgi:transcriptional regulator with XRE-family HTH domain